MSQTDHLYVLQNGLYCWVGGGGENSMYRGGGVAWVNLSYFSQSLSCLTPFFTLQIDLIDPLFHPAVRQEKWFALQIEGYPSSIPIDLLIDPFLTLHPQNKYKMPKNSKVSDINLHIPPYHADILFYCCWLYEFCYAFWLWWIYSTCTPSGVTVALSLKACLVV